MSVLNSLIYRNSKLFFKDKGMFFTSLITPLILIVLYVSFLGNVYRDGIAGAFTGVLELPEKLLNGIVGGELFSSLLAVSCITVAFCSNMLMVQDKVNGARTDLTISPVKSSTLALSYYIASLLVTFVICLVAMAVFFLYLANVGWYMSAADILLLLLDVFLLVMFGTALSSIINCFLTTQGQISAVGTIVSSVYGFICGAYMPISNFSEGLANVISLLPGTYGTSLLRNHAVRGALGELESMGCPTELIDGIKDSIDCNIYFFGTKVEMQTMFAILIVTVAVLVAAYVLINFLRRNKV